MGQLRAAAVTLAATPTAAEDGCPGPCRSSVKASTTVDNNIGNKITLCIAKKLLFQLHKVTKILSVTKLYSGSPDSFSTTSQILDFCVYLFTVHFCKNLGN